MKVSCRVKLECNTMSQQTCKITTTSLVSTAEVCRELLPDDYSTGLRGKQPLGIIS